LPDCDPESECGEDANSDAVQNGERHLGGRRVGLLGGSFNPAHSGHLRISLMAFRALGLDEVWWLVSPQNPLKPTDGMETLEARIQSAQLIARHPRIQVSDIEAQLGTRYTADTLQALCSRHPQTRFVWLMGADNLVQIPRWKNWQRIFETVPVAVFDRPNYSYQALAGMAANRFGRSRCRADEIRSLADRPAPAWAYVWGVRDPQSATALRQKGEQD
jgi:nicotinate-nucleotide adenylyltransferase